jgi:hypothetical protein
MPVMVTMTSVAIVERRAAIPMCQAWRPARPVDETERTRRKMRLIRNRTHKTQQLNLASVDTVERRSARPEQDLSGHPVEFPVLVPQSSKHESRIASGGGR